MSIDVVKAEFLEFWRKHFPEQFEISRDTALQNINEEEFGQHGTSETSAEYQDAVSQVYGAYEEEDLQVRTFLKVMSLLEKYRKKPKNAVSLGCGPAAIELFLLVKGFVEKFTLVDISEQMLERAMEIAAVEGVDDKIKCICDKIESFEPRANAYDLGWTINAMHWSEQWRQWVAKLHKALKQGSAMFVSCTLHHGRSSIEVTDLSAAVKKRMKIIDHNFIRSPEEAQTDGGMAILSFRYYCYGKTIAVVKPSSKKKTKKKRKK